MRNLGDVAVVELVDAPIPCLVCRVGAAPQRATLDGLQVGPGVVEPVAVDMADLQPGARLAQLSVHKDGACLFTTHVYATGCTPVGKAPFELVNFLKIRIVYNCKLTLGKWNLLHGFMGFRTSATVEIFMWRHTRR